MPGREYQQGNQDYRFSINGQEKEKELNKNITTAEFWEYDSRLMRRWNPDPITFFHQSPYCTFNNNPIVLNDPFGLTPPTKETSTKDKPKTLKEIKIYSIRKKEKRPIGNVNNKDLALQVGKLTGLNLERKNHRYNYDLNNVKLDHIDYAMTEGKISANNFAISALNGFDKWNAVWDLGTLMSSMAGNEKADFSLLPLPYGIDVLLKAGNDVQRDLESLLIRDHFRNGYRDFTEFLATTEIGKSSKLRGVYVSEQVMKEIVRVGYFCMSLHSHIGGGKVAYNHPYDSKGKMYDYYIVFPKSEDKQHNKIKVMGILKVE